MSENQGFFARVYEAVKSIPYGKVAAYSHIAAAVGCPRCARQVGWALHVNPDPEGVPCYRVVNVKGRLAEAFAFGGINVQRQLLEKEGVQFDENGLVKKEYFWQPQ